jgi:hypothetical protein
MTLEVLSKIYALHGPISMCVGTLRRQLLLTDLLIMLARCDSRLQQKLRCRWRCGSKAEFNQENTFSTVFSASMSRTPSNMKNASD